MRFPLPSVLALALAPAFVHAENVNLNARAETTTVSLAAYSVGPAIGVVGALNSAMADVSPQFLSLSLAQSVRFREDWDLGMDLDWWLPGSNFGGSLNVSYLLGRAAVRPFLGGGVGIRAVEHEGRFGDGLGPEASVHAGLYLDVLDNLQMRVRVPYRFIANSHRDRAVGLDVAMLFSSPLRRTQVRKLSY